MVYHQESIIYSFHVHILFCFFPLNHWDSDLNSPCLRTNSDLLPLSWTDSISTNMTLPIRVLQHNRIIKIIYDSYCPLNDWTCRTTVKAMRSGLNKFEGDVGKCHTWLCVRDFFFFYCFYSFSLRNSCTVFCKSSGAKERLLVERVSSTVSEGNGNSISWTGKSGFALEFNTPGKKESWFCVFLVYWVTLAQRTSMSFRKLVLRNGLKTFLRKRKQKTNGNNRWRIVSRLKKTS